MPRAAGVYTRAVADYETGDVIQAANFNTEFDDMAAVLTASIANGGQTPTTAVVPFAQGVEAGDIQAIGWEEGNSLFYSERDTDDTDYEARDFQLRSGSARVAPDGTLADVTTLVVATQAYADIPFSNPVNVLLTRNVTSVMRGLAVGSLILIENEPANAGRLILLRTTAEPMAVDAVQNTSVAHYTVAVDVVAASDTLPDANADNFWRLSVYAAGRKVPVNSDVKAGGNELILEGPDGAALALQFGGNASQTYTLPGMSGRLVAGVVEAFPTGAKVLFASTPPAGWTLDEQNAHGLAARVGGMTGLGLQDYGTGRYFGQVFQSAYETEVVTAGGLAHSHAITDMDFVTVRDLPAGAHSSDVVAVVGALRDTGGARVGDMLVTTDGNSDHHHTLDLRLSTYDVVLATKD